MRDNKRHKRGIKRRWKDIEKQRRDAREAEDTGETIERHWRDIEKLLRHL